MYHSMQGRFVPHRPRIAAFSAAPAASALGKRHLRRQALAVKGFRGRHPGAQSCGREVLSAARRQMKIKQSLECLRTVPDCTGVDKDRR